MVSQETYWGDCRFFEINDHDMVPLGAVSLWVISNNAAGTRNAALGDPTTIKWVKLGEELVFINIGPQSVIITQSLGGGAPLSIALTITQGVRVYLGLDASGNRVWIPDIVRAYGRVGSPL